MNIQIREKFGKKNRTNNPINNSNNYFITLTKIIISKCLGFEACRWNGEIIAAPWLQELSSKVELVPICPEVDIGLSVPRKPINLYQCVAGIKVIQDETGIDLTDKLVSYSQEYLKYIGTVDGFILKSKSPSCGNESTYIHYKDKMNVGSGVFVSMAKNYFPNAVFVDEKFLEKYGVESFISKIS
jgi:uncharacterized protein YbbK (DUF523 family)